MWLGEQITEHGIGNGISLIIFIGIVARFPTDIINTIRALRVGTLSPIVAALMLIDHDRRDRGGRRDDPGAVARSRCSTRSAWWAARCTAARARTSRSASTPRA